MVLGGKMEQIRVYFLEIIDLNNQKHQIKSDDYNKILNFVQMYENKNKTKDISLILFLFSLTSLNIVLCFYNNICILMFFFGRLIIK